MKKYEIEREGQLDFFHDYIKLVDSSLTEDDIINDNNDGVVNGNILEFKLQISNLNAVLFQTIKYLSALRSKGKPVPANILLISLNEAKAYVYHSKDYLDKIEKVYNKSASLSNEGFTCGPYDELLNYKENDVDEARLIEIMRSTGWTKINIDENCIVGWATRYYKENKDANKSDFIGDTEGKVKIIGEIRKPTYFKDYINPYTGKTNEKFKYLMDKLNDAIQKKELGAFYTAELYADKSLELLRKAIARVPEGNDYIILDRCAGTGNLERHLTKEELGHCILSTIEYYEYKVLVETLGDKVRHIIPPTERDDTFNKGLVRGANALSEEYVNNALLKKYIENPNCTIILFENPPYIEIVATELQKTDKKQKKSKAEQDFVVKEMKKETSGVVSRDIGNAFIWSAFKYYLRQPTDSYIVYSPVKYWKIQHLVNKKFNSGFAFNRRHFHTDIDACIMCAYWENVDDTITKTLKLEAYDIKDDKLVKEENPLYINRIFATYSEKYFDKRKMDGDEAGIVGNLNGTERTSGTIQLKNPIYNPNIVGYLSIRGANFDNPDLNVSLLSIGRYDGGGFYLRKDNYLEKMPMFASTRYITYNRYWTERARIMKSGDGAAEFYKDLSNPDTQQFLLKCLLFATLEMQNHCRSFIGSDNRPYTNHLCLDDTHGDTLASAELKRLTVGPKEKELLEQWQKVLADARKTAKYDNNVKYGVYQIYDELNTSKKDEETGETLYDYPSLNGNLATLKTLVKKYYLSEIVPMLFKYEFLK